MIMEALFEKPNLPDRKAKMLIVGEMYSKLLEGALSEMGVAVLCCPQNPCVDSRLASHADLSVFHMGGKRFLLAPYLKNTDFSRSLESFGAELCYSKLEQKSVYPRDAGLCALNVGAMVFHNQKLSDPAIVSAKGFVHVSQVYAKFAVLMLDEKNAITSDRGMAMALREQGIEVLEISEKGISLEGFENGFIGGSAFLLSRDTVVFTGNLDAHPDKSKIEAFLQKKSKKARFLTKMPIFDIGSAIPVF